MRTHGKRRRSTPSIQIISWLAAALMATSLSLTSTTVLARPPSAAAVTRDCPHCPEMMAVSGGRFLMGTATDDPMHDALESPQHAVSVRPFFAGKYDVTRAEWAYFVRKTGRATVKGCQWTGKAGQEGERSAAWNDLGFEQADQDPVVCVTWGDAEDYARWLSRVTHKHYRLLSEAEWEYAARAGTTTPYFWRSGQTHEHANHGKETCCGGLASGRDKWIYTSPGGAFPPNGFGLYDMSGNVLQWVEDCFSPNYEGLPANGAPFLTARPIVATGDLKDLSATSTCDYRVVRGGDWGDQSGWIRTAARSFAPPPGPGPNLASYRSGGVGFRVARD